MPRFLSPAWIVDVAAAAAGSAELAAATAGVRLVVEQTVTGGPDGDVRYVVCIDDGRVTVAPGGAADADVRLATDWDAAVAMATGASGAQDAVAAGRLRLGGDLTALVRHAGALDGLDRVFADVRERTTY